MSSEYCPHCGSIQNMRESVSRRKLTTAGGETKEIEAKYFHCETCNSFVRSEDTQVLENEPKRSPNKLLRPFCMEIRWTE